MSGGVILAVLAAALLVWPSGGAGRERRVRPFLPAGAGPLRRSGRWEPSDRQRRHAMAGATGLVAGLLLGGASGVAVAAVVALATERLLSTATPDQEHADRAAVREELPAACDLLAVCLAAGLPVGAALEAVAGVVPGPLGEALRGVAGLYRLGAEPRRAWAAQPPDLAALGRVLTRAAEGGSAAGPALRALAVEARAAARADTEAAVRRAGVGVLAPLGLCFLPAFVCLGVAPLVLGLVAEVFD